jgi:hypothetical protein
LSNLLSAAGGKEIFADIPNTAASVLLTLIQLEIEFLVLDFWRNTREPYRSIITGFLIFEAGMVAWTQWGTPPLWVDIAFVVHAVVVLSIFALVAVRFACRRLWQWRSTTPPGAA